MDDIKMVSEKKKKLFLGAAVAALAIIAILGYALEGKKEPLRVAFDTRGGGVVFDHKIHVLLKDTGCKECHHNYEPGVTGETDSPAMRCRECHYSKKYKGLMDDESIHKRLIGKNCIECHKQGSVNCQFCHNAENFGPFKTPEQVEFDTEGGRVVFDHSTHVSADGYELECDSCHHGYKAGERRSFPLNCRRCHYNKKYELLCSIADTHARCIGKNCLECHSDDAENCEKCHKE